MITIKISKKITISSLLLVSYLIIYNLIVVYINFPIIASYMFQNFALSDTSWVLIFDPLFFLGIISLILRYRKYHFILIISSLISYVFGIVYLLLFHIFINPLSDIDTLIFTSTGLIVVLIILIYFILFYTKTDPEQRRKIENYIQNLRDKFTEVEIKDISEALDENYDIIITIIKDMSKKKDLRGIYFKKSKKIVFFQDQIDNIEFLIEEAKKRDKLKDNIKKPI